MGRIPPHDEKKVLLRAQVAYLASEGLTQKRIATLLSLSQSSVSNLLNEASNPPDGALQLLDPRPRFLGNGKARRRIQDSLFIGELQNSIVHLAQKRGWRVVPTVHIGLTEGGGQSWDNQVKMWGSSLAPMLVELLRPCKSIAVAWGRQLRGLVQSIAALQVTRKSSDQALVFACWPPRLSVRPESDDKMFKDHIALGSNSLAFDLSVALNGEDARNKVARYFLPGIDMFPFSDPPFVIGVDPPNPTLESRIRNEEDTLRDFKAALFQIQSYSLIFGDLSNHTDDGMLRQADALIAGAGPAGGARSFAMGGDYGGIPLEWFGRYTVGDIGGCIFPYKPVEEMSPGLKTEFQRLRSHWLGLQEGDLAHVARHGKVGTIVAAVGADRVNSILYGCQQELISHLLCDPGLARALAAKIKDELRQ